MRVHDDTDDRKNTQHRHSNQMVLKSIQSSHSLAKAVTDYLEESAALFKILINVNRGSAKAVAVSRVPSLRGFLSLLSARRA
jgi:hypothetical protein